MSVCIYIARTPLPLQDVGFELNHARLSRARYTSYYIPRAQHATLEPIDAPRLFLHHDVPVCAHGHVYAHTHTHVDKCTHVHTQLCPCQKPHVCACLHAETFMCVRRYVYTYMPIPIPPGNISDFDCPHIHVWASSHVYARVILYVYTCPFLLAHVCVSAVGVHCCVHTHACVSTCRHHVTAHANPCLDLPMSIFNCEPSCLPASFLLAHTRMYAQTLIDTHAHTHVCIHPHVYFLTRACRP